MLDIQQLAIEQLQPWNDFSSSNDSYIDKVNYLASTRHSVFLINVGNSGIKVHSKNDSQINIPNRQAYYERLENYTSLFADMLAQFPVYRETLVAVDVEDEALEERSAPVFSFQKKRGESNLLLPDVEIITSGYFNSLPIDDIHFNQKKNCCGICWIDDRWRAYNAEDC